MIEAGIHRIDAATYHADKLRDVPTLSSTLARLVIDRSPLHAWAAHPRLNPDWQPTESKAFDFGRAAHTAVLGRGEEYVAIPDDLLAANGAATTKAAREFVSEVRASGKTPLKAEEIERIDAMVCMLRDRLAAMGITLDSDRSEIVALSEVEGTWCRAMVDNAPADPAAPLYDFKTTTDASPEACVRAVTAYGYDLQAQWYREVWRAATGEDRGFRFIFQEKTQPFEVCVVELDGEAMELAARKTRRAREIWRGCLRSGRWPGYPLGVHRVGLPAWYHERWLERESADAEIRARTGTDILDYARRWQAPEQEIE